MEARVEARVEGDVANALGDLGRALVRVRNLTQDLLGIFRFDIIILSSCAFTAITYPACTLPALGMASCLLIRQAAHRLPENVALVVHDLAAVFGAACCMQVSTQAGWWNTIPSCVFWMFKYAVFGKFFVGPSLRYVNERFGRALVVGFENMMRALDAEDHVIHMTRASLAQAAPLRSRARPAPPGHAGARDLFCAICHDTYAEAGLHRVLKCGHGFHAVCIDEWLLGRADQCPMCRVSVM